MNRSWIAAVTCLFLLVGAGTVAADLPFYEVEYLGPVTGAVAINGSSQMVGSATLWGNLRGWVAGPGAPPVPLPLPPGMLSSFASDLNDQGVIVGTVSAQNSPEFSPQAARWTPDGNGGYAVDLLGMLPGHVGSDATAINNLGDVVGVSRDSMYRYAVLFTAPEGILDLSPWGIFDPTDINEQRVLVDNSFTVKRFDLNSLQVEDLGVPAGGGWLATRSVEINEENQVAGIAILACCDNCDYHAARYTDASGWEVLSGCGLNNMATGLNDLGDVLMRLNTDVHVYFEGLGSHRLQDLISTELGQWYVFNGFGNVINNAREIGTFAINNDTGQSGLVLLHPTVATSASESQATANGAESGLLSLEPNPFRSSTAIRFAPSQAAIGSSVRLRVVDVTGRVVRNLINGSLESGPQTVIWDASDDNGNKVSAGIYFLVMESGSTRLAMKSIHLR